MWNNGFHLLWSHITNLYIENLNYVLKLVPKLIYEHISLSPYSVMNDCYAAQYLVIVLVMYYCPFVHHILMVQQSFV